MNDATIDHFAKMVQDFGFPVIAAIGLGYFVFYVWKWVTKDISPTIGESKKTLIGLIDKDSQCDKAVLKINCNWTNFYNQIVLNKTVNNNQTQFKVLFTLDKSLISLDFATSAP